MAFLGIQRDAWEQSLVSPNCLRLQLDLVSDYALVWKLESPTKNEFERFSMDVAAGVCSFNELNAHWRNLRAVERTYDGFLRPVYQQHAGVFPVYSAS